MKRYCAVASLFIILILTGCSNNSPTETAIIEPRPIGHLEFVPGEVVVGVDSGVTHPFFQSFIDSLHLAILDWTYDVVAFWIEIPSGTADRYIAELSSDSLFSDIYKTNYPFPDSVRGSDYLHALYKIGKDASDTSEGRIAVQSLGLTLQRVEVYSMAGNRSALVSVPRGTELSWISRFKSFSFIRYAELNYFAIIWQDERRNRDMMQ